MATTNLNDPMFAGIAAQIKEARELYLKGLLTMDHYHARLDNANARQEALMGLRPRQQATHYWVDELTEDKPNYLNKLLLLL